jgi:enolase-phosphatase E1
MIAFHGKLILLDIEGTVSPLAFVHDEMFPYARKNAAAFLASHFDDDATQGAINQMARDAGQGSFAAWCPVGVDQREFVVTEVEKLMDADVKATGLKLLQGLIWKQGFHSGELRSTLFADVPQALAAWRAAGIDVRIYSSGSVHAQKLFFAHTEAGDLTPDFNGYYDTTIGSKRETASYAAIAAEAGVGTGDVLFVSDIVEELDAARTAGIKTALAIRPGNKPSPSTEHPSITTLYDIHLA